MCNAQWMILTSDRLGTWPFWSCFSNWSLAMHCCSRRLSLQPLIISSIKWHQQVAHRASIPWINCRRSKDYTASYFRVQIMRWACPAALIAQPSRHSNSTQWFDMTSTNISRGRIYLTRCRPTTLYLTSLKKLLYTERLYLEGNTIFTEERKANIDQNQGK